MERDRPDLHSRRNFILQQGLPPPTSEECPVRFSALMFQPRVVGLLVVTGVLLQSPGLFLVLSAVLWWNVVFPRWNPFDAFYNRTLGARPGAAQLSAAPPPRRFAQGIAGSFALGIGGSLLAGWGLAAYVLEALMLAALAALTFGRFCLGSTVYYLLRGQADFARRTFPWSRG